MPALPYSIAVLDEECSYLKSLIKAKTIQAQVVDRIGVSVNTMGRIYFCNLGGSNGNMLFDMLY